MRPNPLRDVWTAMHRRCKRQRGHKDYPHYMGRGITVCKRWNSFAAFKADMPPYPGNGWSIERENNDEGYSALNCVWATPKKQNRNRDYPLRARDITRIRKLYQGDCRLNRGGLSHQAIADMYGVGRTTITNILLRNTWV